MPTVKKLVAIALFSIAVACVISLAESKTTQGAPAPDKDVRVTNSIAEPVPTLAQGTTAISGAVQATQSGSWNVEVLGTPTVQVANVATSPVWVRVVDDPARQPFQRSLHLAMAFGTFVSDGAFNVPANKQLVIEYVTFDGTVDPGEKLRAKIETIAGGINSGPGHVLVLNDQGVFAGEQSYRASQIVRLYADPATSVSVSAARDSSAGEGFVNFTISGYLVDLH